MSIIILTSSGQTVTSSVLVPYLPRPLSEMKMLYIITASKKVNDIDYIKVRTQAMDDSWYHYTLYDIDWKNKWDLEEVLSQHDAVYVEWGNTFFLLKCIRETGFADLVKQFMANGGVYIGSSAGSYVACPTIISATLSQENFDRCWVMDFTAMGFVDITILAHYSEEKQQIIDMRKNELEPYNLIRLTDREAIVVKDGEITKITTP